jgi:HAD superfamily hydrolase (TIGR01509 family)
MISPKGAIFDQDGLLFDTEVIFEQAWIKAGKEHGLPIDLALTHRFAAETQLAMKPVMKPGVREMLAFCKSRCIRTAIASSSMRHLVDNNLGVTGLTEYFDAVVTGRDVANGKTLPDIFLLAAERIGVPTSDCVVFEDAFTGIRAAHAAGCRPVLIPDRRAPVPEILEICEVYPTLSDAIVPVWGNDNARFGNCF